jgi:outer membrane protein
MLLRPGIILCAALFLASAHAATAADGFLGALDQAYTNNPRIKAERERQKSTDEQVAEAVSGFRPSARISYEDGRQRTDNGTGNNYSDLKNQSLRIEQPLFRGGGTIASVQAANARVDAGSARLSGIEQQVLFEAIEAYMNVVQAQSILDISRNNEDVLKQQLKASQERFEVGEVTRTDVAQSEARLSNASAQVIAAEGELISAIAGYERVVGNKPEAALVAPGTFPEVPASLKEALSMADAKNPQLLQAINTERAAKYDVRTNVARILPSVSLVGNMSKQEGAGLFGNSDFDQDSLTVNVSIPLYQSGAEYARIRSASAVRQQRMHEAMNAKQFVAQQVTTAWEQYETAMATIVARQDQIKAAEVALDGVKQEQEYGARTVLDVLNAEQELFIAKSNLVRADRDHVVALFGLVQAMGELTPETLTLASKSYDPTENYDRVKWLPIGF